MISLIQYDEFGANMGFPSIKDFFQSKRYEGQDKIIQYLKNGKCTMASPGRAVDVITGEVIDIEVIFMNDGKYSWTSTLIYYVEKYNLRLPLEFEKYVLNVTININSTNK